MSNYPDAPAVRMAYDRDGTQTYLTQYSGSTSALTNVEVQALNNESDDEFFQFPNGTGNAYLFMAFPELRDLAGYYFNWRPGNASYVAISQMASSVDSTNGVDGTWVAFPSPAINVAVQTKPDYRLSIRAISRPAIKMVRFTVTTFQNNSLGEAYWRTIHLYGKKSAQTSNAVTLWHPTLDQPLSDFPTWLDWGDIPRGSGAVTRTFRVKNTSATLIAQGISVSANALTDASAPTVVSQYAFALGGGYQTPLGIGDLAPGAISGVISVRLNLDITSQLGLWSQRLLAVPTAWV
jgi:hypothetical protein